MTIKRKLKKVNKLLLWTYIILAVLMLASSATLTINISYLAGIETFLRIIVLVIMYLSFSIYLLYGLVWLFERKNIKLTFLSFIIAALCFVNFFASHYINKTYRIIDNINKDEITYTSSLVNLSKNTFSNTSSSKIGMIENEEDISGNILAKELIKKEKINSEVITQGSYQELMELLYEEKIDAIFLPGNYDTLFSEDDGFDDVKKDTKVLYSFSKKMKKAEDTLTGTIKNITEPITILLLGVDSTANGLSSNAAFNGDAIMLITFNPSILSATFLSIPRDTYVPITCNGNKEAKINKAAYSGSKCMMDTITKLTGVKIDYYFKMNFTGVVDLVDTIGGIEVTVPYKFCEQDSQRRFGKNTIYLNEGFQKLNGEQALALTRNRKGHPECSAEWNGGTRNDFVRGQNQQLVVQALLNKLKKIRNINDLYKVVNVVSNNMDTNMQTETLLSFYNIGKNILFNSSENDGLKIEKLYLQTTNLMIAGAGSTEQYQKNSLNAITKAMKINLGLIEPDLNKSFSFDINSPYEEAIIGKGLYDGITRKVLPSFIGKPKSEVSAFANSNNISITYENITSGNSLYKEEYENGTIVSQSIKANTLIDNVKSLTVGVISK